MAKPLRCPACGAELPVQAAEGLCPKCLLGVGLEASVPSSVPAAEAATLPPSDASRGPASLVDSQTESTVGPPPLGKVRYFGDYELLEEIARGGMGVVYKARQVNLKRIVALKMILAGQLASGDEVKRFYAEAEAAAKLDHPNIVPIFEVGQHEGQHYFSMAFVEGESLAHKIAGGVFAPREAAEMVKKVAEAIAYAHVEGVVHRDLKPANVLIDKDGQPRVTDFGLAKRVRADDAQSHAVSQLTATGAVLGTPSYMPPEQAAGKTSEIGPLADVYSLGAILYCLVTGRPPFQAASPLDTLLQVLEREPDSPRKWNKAVDRNLAAICLKCLEKEPGRRYGSAADLAADLERWLNDEIIQARPPGVLERITKTAERQPLVTVPVGVSIVAATWFVAKMWVPSTVALFWIHEFVRMFLWQMHLWTVAAAAVGGVGGLFVRRPWRWTVRGFLIGLVSGIIEGGLRTIAFLALRAGLGDAENITPMHLFALYLVGCGPSGAALGVAVALFVGMARERISAWLWRGLLVGCIGSLLISLILGAMLSGAGRQALLVSALAAVGSAVAGTIIGGVNGVIRHQVWPALSRGLALGALGGLLLAGLMGIGSFVTSPLGFDGGPMHRYWLMRPSQLLQSKKITPFREQGGWRLVYQVQSQPSSETIDAEAVIAALKRRIDPVGKHGVLFVNQPDDRVELSVPRNYPGGLASAKHLLTQEGVLEFRILANDREDATAVEEAIERMDRDGPNSGPSGYQWAKLYDPEGFSSLEGISVRNGFVLTKLPTENIRLSGEHLLSASVDFDFRMRPAVALRFNASGAAKLALLTNRYSPKANGTRYHLAIMLDRRVMSAPVINSPVESGTAILEGGKAGFTDEEVQELVAILNSGPLPVRLEPNPLEEEKVPPAIQGANRN